MRAQQVTKIDPFQLLGPIKQGRAEEVLWRLLPEALPRLAQWTRRSVDALPSHESSAPGYRDLVPSEDGEICWCHPRSNAAERIEVYLWLARRLKDATFGELAVRYANAMADDPVRGIYRGDEQDGVGQVWYWNDSGLYMTNYTIRVPPAFLELARATGNNRYRELAELSGRQLLVSQQSTGILREGWHPETPVPGSPTIDRAVRDRWLSSIKINVRVGYVVRAFAELWLTTKDDIYLSALNRFVETFETYQNADGSFPQDIRTDRIGVHSPLVKGHFMHYVLNGFALAAAARLPGVPSLARVAERLAQFLLRQYRQCGGMLYGNVWIDEPAERFFWRTAMPDAIAGLAWLGQITGRAVYREAACRIALSAILSSFDCPDLPDLHGGVPSWPHPDDTQLPSIDGYGHFWTLLGIKALEETAP